MSDDAEGKEVLCCRLEGALLALEATALGKISIESSSADSEDSALDLAVTQGLPSGTGPARRVRVHAGIRSDSLIVRGTMQMARFDRVLLVPSFLAGVAERTRTNMDSSSTWNGATGNATIIWQTRMMCRTPWEIVSVESFHTLWIAATVCCLNPKPHLIALSSLH